jgi:leucyl aminopeptidase (aminopeptidase T)
LHHPLNQVSFDPALAEGARNAVRVCLRIQPQEKVCVIADAASEEIAASLVAEIEAVGAPYHAWLLEDETPRPMPEMPPRILDDLDTSQVSIYTVQAQEGELRTRMQMTEVINRRKIRHAHMVNINRQIMLEGMRANFLEVDAISQRVWEVARTSRTIRARSAAGTDIVAEMNPNYRWLKTSGIISPDKWGNLPGGEVFTAPENVSGTFVIDGVVGDYLCSKYGALHAEPLTIRVHDNRLREAWSSNRALEEEFWAYTHTDENSDRVGEFAIGTNIALRDVIGHILQDEKIPGVHIAFGNPYGEHTGAPWHSSTHIDVVGTQFDIWCDQRQIMRNGEFLL